MTDEDFRRIEEFTKMYAIPDGPGTILKEGAGGVPLFIDDECETPVLRHEKPRSIRMSTLDYGDLRLRLDKIPPTADAA